MIRPIYLALPFSVFLLTQSLQANSICALQFGSAKKYTEQTKAAVIEMGALSSKPVVFEVQDGTGSLLIQVSARRNDSDYVVSTMEDPHGKVYKFDSRGDSSLISNAYYPGYAMALMTPEKGQSSLTAGAWKLTVKTFEKSKDSEQLDVRIIETKPPSSKIQKLKINLHLTNSFGLTRENFSESILEKGIADLKAIYIRYGIDIEIGEIVDYKIRSQEIVIDPDNRSFSLEELINTPEAMKEGLNIFLIESIDRYEAQGGSPGAPGVFIDNPKSGAIVVSNFRDPLMRLKPMGLLLAHEIGHFLGRKHPYEVGEPMPVALDLNNIMIPDTLAEIDNSKLSFTREEIRTIKTHPMLN